MNDIEEKFPKVQISNYNHSFSISNKVGRIIWNIVYYIFFRPLFLNVRILKILRNFILRLFGAKIGKSVNIYSSVKIWVPWNLEVGDYSTIGPKVNIYNQGKITIGSNTVISQKSFLCASTHDFEISNYPLLLKPIKIGDQVWIAADAFIGPNVTISEGAVIGARSAVFKSVEQWTVVGGNPAKFIRKREMKDA